MLVFRSSPELVLQHPSLLTLVHHPLQYSQFPINITRLPQRDLHLPDPLTRIRRPSILDFRLKLVTPRTAVALSIPVVIA